MGGEVDDEPARGADRVVGLVGCVKSKLSSPAAARDLYVSPLFVGRRLWVERTCDRWFILSARHGLVVPEQVLEPYDETLADASSVARRQWSQHVLVQLEGVLGDLGGTHFEIHAGAAYRDYGLVSGLKDRGATVEVPAAGLSQGRQLAFYQTRQSLGGGSASPEVKLLRRPARSAERPPHKYFSLQQYLREAASPLTVTFVEVERVLGGPLPASARAYRPWWANDPSHVQARSWLDEGWNVVRVDMKGETVTFSTGH